MIITGPRTTAEDAAVVEDLRRVGAKVAVSQLVTDTREGLEGHWRRAFCSSVMRNTFQAQADALGIELPKRWWEQ